MKLKPTPWTHHHAHRLFHMTMGMCFGFASLVMVAGMGTFWLSAGAAQEDVTITANVGGVNPGPVDSGSSGSYRPPVSAAEPTLTIAAEPQGKVPRVVIGSGSNQVAAYAFATNKPAFSGTTSVSNGIVFIYIEGPKNLNSTARASANGLWYWESPDSFPVGTYSIVATVYDSYDLTKSATVKEYFAVSIPVVPTDPTTPSIPGATPPPSGGPGAGQQPQPGTGTEQPPVIPPTTIAKDVFGLFVEIIKRYESVPAGSKTVAWVSLVSNLDRPITDQEIKYTVTSPQGKIILESSDLVSFSKLSQFLKEFTLAPLTPPGQYTLRISSTYNGIESVSSDKFTVTPAPASATVAPQGAAVVWSLLLLLLGLFLVLMIIAYRWVRHHTRELNDPQSINSTT